MHFVSKKLLGLSGVVTVSYTCSSIVDLYQSIKSIRTIRCSVGCCALQCGGWIPTFRWTLLLHETMVSNHHTSQFNSVYTHAHYFCKIYRSMSYKFPFKAPFFNNIPEPRSTVLLVTGSEVARDFLQNLQTIADGTLRQATTASFETQSPFTIISPSHFTVSNLCSWNRSVNNRRINYVRFEVFKAVKIQVVVFWVVTPCSDVLGYRRFGGSYCLQQGPSKRGYPTAWLHDVTTQKTTTRRTDGAFVVHWNVLTKRYRYLW